MGVTSKQKQNRHHNQKSTSELIKCKGVVDVFFNGKNVIHHEFVPCGQTVNGQFYLEVVKCLGEAEQRKWPEVWKTKTWMQHHDSEPAHMLVLSHEYFSKHDTTVALQLPRVLFLFPMLKSTLKVC
jgi:hypothetical protein